MGINSTVVKLLSHRKEMLYPKSRCRTALYDSWMIACHFKDLFINFNMRIYLDDTNIKDFNINDNEICLT